MSKTIEAATTTELENWERKFPIPSDCYTKFEFSAILKGIRAELAERRSEKDFIMNKRECTSDAREIEQLEALCVEYLEKIDGLTVALEETQFELDKLEKLTA